MTVSMGIRNRDSGEYNVVPVAASETFRRWWLPACEHLGLELVAHFHDGALTEVQPEYIPQIIGELGKLRVWASSQSEREFMIERIDDILHAFRETNPAKCAYEFG